MKNQFDNNKFFNSHIYSDMEDITVVVWAVDDDNVWLASLKLFLKKHGVDLFVFNDHEDFFDLLDDKVDIVLMDVHMPNFDIRAGLKKMYAINNRILTILMTSEPDYKTINSIRNGNGIFRFVEKGALSDNNNPIAYMGEVVDFNCFEAIRIFIDQAKEHLLLTQPIREQIGR